MEETDIEVVQQWFKPQQIVDAKYAASIEITVTLGIPSPPDWISMRDCSFKFLWSISYVTIL